VICLRHISIIILALCLSFEVLSQTFGNVTSAQNIFVPNLGGANGNGVSFADFNGDGWDDLSFAQYNANPVFYQNLEGTFQFINLGVSVSGDVKMIQWVDYDNDGDKDLFITVEGDPVKLYNNDGAMNLTEVTEDAGLQIQWVNHYGSCWGDINNDGWLDLYVCKYHNAVMNQGYEYTNHLYKNLGNGTFEDITLSSGTGNGVKASFQSVFVDVNRDGFEDIFVINDRLTESNALFLNNGDETFLDVTTSSGMEIYMDAMTASPGDFDNDGDLDIFISNSDFGNKFMLDNGDGTYTDIAEDLGVLINETCWAGVWIDFDCNGREDLYVATTHDGLDLELQNEFFRNYDDDTFVNIEGSIGLGQDNYATYAVAMGDFNQDGYPEFAQNNAQPSDCQLFQNSGWSNHWMKVNLEGTLSNRDGIGNYLDLFTNGESQTRYTHCGEGYLSQYSHSEFFGLSDQEMADSLVITWRSGWQETFYNLNADSCYHIVEGQTLGPVVEITTTFMCEGDSIVLSGLDGWDSYSWSTGTDAQSTTITEAGTYILTAYLGDLPLGVDSVIVNYPEHPSVSSTVNSVSCFDQSNGSIELEVDSTEVLDLTWQDGTTEFNIDSLTAGFYTFSFADAFDCEYTDSIQVFQPTQITVMTETINPSCFGFEDGSVTVQSEGGTPPFVVEIIDADTLDLMAGDYEGLVTDSLGCQHEFIFTLEQPDPLNIDITTSGANDGASGSAEADITGGTPPYSINWSNGQTDVFQIEDLAEGDFSIVVTDSLGCMLEFDFIITHLSEL
jgi:hypothetical protein